MEKQLDLFTYNLPSSEDTVPKPEILRCKDCRYFEKHKEKDEYFCYKSQGMVEPMPEGYCSYAERKEG